MLPDKRMSLSDVRCGGAFNKAPVENFLGNPFKNLEREDARKNALSAARNLAQSQEHFAISLNDFNGSSELKSLLKIHSTIGLFNPCADWFEASNVEAFLNSIDPSASFSFAYPHIDSSNAMSFKTCRKDELQMSPQFKNLLEAPALAPTIQPTLLFIPCTLADKQGHRMGRGQGHYDRYIQHNPNVQRVGIVHTRFLMQCFPESWVQAHDQDMNALLTQRQFFRPTTKETQTL